MKPTALGGAVGKLYVQRYFRPAKGAPKLVKNLMARSPCASITSVDGAADAHARRQAPRDAEGQGWLPDHWRSFAALDVCFADAMATPHAPNGSAPARA
jgi:hypothetical protein